MNHVVNFPAATEHASQTLMDLIVRGRGLGNYVSERFHGLASFLPADFRCQSEDLCQIFLVLSEHVENGTADDLGYVAGETTRKLFEDVAVAVIRRATACARDIARMFENGDGPTVVTKSASWGRFDKDLLTVDAILRCLNRPKKDADGKVVRDDKGEVVKLKGLFIQPSTFVGRRANPGEIEKGIQPPMGYLDSLIKINEQTGGCFDQLVSVVNTVSLITRKARI